VFELLTDWNNKLVAAQAALSGALRIVKAHDQDTTEQIDVHRHIQPVIDMWYPLLRASKCVPELDLRASVSLCEIAVAAFREILSVLLVNSVQAHSHTLKIRSYNQSRALVPQNKNLVAPAFCLDIDDDGTGLAIDDVEDIVKPTYSTKADKFGTGLGLFIARRLAWRRGGDLYVSDRKEGRRGVTFRLVLKMPRGSQK
jgi:C4-dicarboxylate-specific signal transduction histidine kinase